EGHRGEVAPDRRVLRAGQQHHLGALGAATRAPDLLVVGDGGGGGAHVHHEPQVGFVETHAERGGGDQRLDLVAQQCVLQRLAFGRVGLAGVGGDVVAVGVQHVGEVVRGGDGEGVDDAR